MNCKGSGYQIRDPASVSYMVRPKNKRTSGAKARSFCSLSNGTAGSRALPESVYETQFLQKQKIPRLAKPARRGAPYIRATISRVMINLLVISGSYS